MFVRRFRVQPLSLEDDRTGWNRVTFEISTAFVALLMVAAVLAAIWIYDSVTESESDVIESPQECIERGGEPTTIDIPDDGKGPVGACEGAAF